MKVRGRGVALHKLSAARVATATKPGRYYDGGNLALIVEASGRKSKHLDCAIGDILVNDRTHAEDFFTEQSARNPRSSLLRRCSRFGSFRALEARRKVGWRDIGRKQCPIAGIERVEEALLRAPVPVRVQVCKLARGRDADRRGVTRRKYLKWKLSASGRGGHRWAPVHKGDSVGVLGHLNLEYHHRP